MKKIIAVIAALIVLLGFTPSNKALTEGDDLDLEIIITSKTDSSKVYTIDNVTSLPYELNDDQMVAMVETMLTEPQRYQARYDMESTDDSKVTTDGWSPACIIVKALTGDEGVELTGQVMISVYASYDSTNITVVVVCRAKNYDVTADQNMSNGTVSFSKNKAAAGENITVTPEPEQGYVTDKVTYAPAGQEATEITKTENGYVFEMPRSNVVVGASFKALPEVTDPQGKILKYNGEDQELIVKGSTTGGTLVYSQDGKNFSEDIPKGKDPATYSIWYKVIGNDDYAGTEASYIESRIDNVYSVSSGNGTVWEQGSSGNVVISFTSAYEEEDTFSRFSDGGIILVDGKELSSENYEISAGSLVVALKNAYLKTLSVGDHTMNAVFFDGTSETAVFTIKAKPVSSDRTTTSYKAPVTGID